MNSRSDYSTINIVFPSSIIIIVNVVDYTSYYVHTSDWHWQS